MKRRIADWVYRFWLNNHSHVFELFEATMTRERCRYCGKIRKV